MPEVFTSDYRLEKIGANSYTYNANSLTEYVNEPAKVSGAWLTYPDGSRFRRPTAYDRAGFTIRRGSSERMTGHTVLGNRPWSVITGAGGLVGNYATGNWTSQFHSYNIPTLLNSPGFDFFERNESTTKALSKIADGKAQVGENLATLGQTIRMVKDPASAYLRLLQRGYKEGKGELWRLGRHSYRDLIRGNVSEKLASLYLQYVYGFKPLMQDIHSLLSYAKEVGVKPLFLSGVGKASNQHAPRDKHYVNVSRERDEFLEGIEIASRTRTVLWAKLNSEWQAIRALNQLGMLNPASLVWELIPFSFVLDWFIPVGSMLGALTAPAGLDFVGGSDSRSVALMGNIRNHQLEVSGYKIDTLTPATGQLFYRGYTRMPIYSWPTPGLYWDSDPLGLSRDGSDRVLKAIALGTLKLPRL